MTSLELRFNGPIPKHLLLVNTSSLYLHEIRIFEGINRQKKWKKALHKKRIQSYPSQMKK